MFSHQYSSCAHIGACVKKSTKVHIFCVCHKGKWDFLSFPCKKRKNGGELAGMLFVNLAMSKSRHLLPLWTKRCKAHEHPPTRFANLVGGCSWALHRLVQSGNKCRLLDIAKFTKSIPANSPPFFRFLQGKDKKSHFPLWHTQKMCTFVDFFTHAPICAHEEYWCENTYNTF